MSENDPLLQKLRASPRDEALWCSLYQRLHPQLYLLTLYLCDANRDLAQDLTQDAFLRFFRSDGIRKVSTSSAAVAYLRAIIRNLVRDHFRMLTRHPTVSTASVTSGELERALNRLVQRTIRDVDFAILPDLRSSDRELLRLAIEGRTVAEVAEQLGVTYSAAAVRLHRLRKYLRNECKETGPGPVLQDKKG